MAEEDKSKPLGRVETKAAAVEMKATAQALTSMSNSLKNLKGEAGEIAGDVAKSINKAAAAYRDISSEVYNTVEGERDYEKILKKNQQIKQQMLDLEIEKEIVLARISTATDDEIAGYRTLLRGIYDTVEAVEAQATATAQVAETTKEIVSFYREITDYNWVGIRLCSKGDLSKLIREIAYDKFDAIDKQWRKERFASIKESAGFTEAFYMPDKNTGLGTLDLEVKQKSEVATKAELARAFKKHMGSKMTNKTILNAFIEQIA